MLTSEKLITSINTVKNVSTGFFPENIPPKSIFIKDTSKKSANFAPMFMSNADNFVTPSGIPTIVAATIPSRIDPFTFFAWSTPITTRPTNATNAPHTSAMFPSSLLHCAKSTMLTSVDGLLTTSPAFFKPMIVINRPIPGVIASFTASGMERMIASRRPTAVITMKKIPEINTMTSASL